ncbi:MAG TPA: assimilatory sulfite reductase (NADPH) flavoprotein subunit [Xanthomonadaceae bacterium]|nr:assimilatory sulfite reductase (NADPH) flavoprotein subunit [Xanthomonadaceae bacterium]
MTALPALSSIPLSEERGVLLARLTEGLDAAALHWLSGYAAGLATQQLRGTRALQVVPAAETFAVESQRVEADNAACLTIVFGSQTGNARRLAERLAHATEAAGIAVRLLRADAHPTRELRNERHLVFVISTQGDGDPPDDARGLVEFIVGKRAPQLPGLHYAVLGLGDSSYPQFCAIGRKLDERLAELGGKRWFARGDADLDVDSVATPWLDHALAAAKESLPPQAPLATVTSLRPLAATSSAWTRDNPFAAELLVNQRITGRGGDKDIRHVELSLEGSGLRYEPGDALGVWPINPPKLVDAVLATLGLHGESIVSHGGQSLPLRQWLGEKRELTRLSRPFVASHAVHARNDALSRLLAPDSADAFAKLLAGQQVIDLLRAYPDAWSGEELVAALRPLAPRLYSIASSQRQVGDEAHLTVAHVEYDVDGDARWGAASHFLARADEGEKLPVFIERNERFRLPRDASRDIIMIGPGTGVAPFRGFVQERAGTGAGGRNWLFFGNQHARSDFLYQVEWQEALKRGELHRLDLAFSRDRLRAVGSARAQEKTYVQQRLRERGRDVYDWLRNGSHVYVCGAIGMGKGVHAALIGIVAEHGGKSVDDATDYLNELQAQGRYARDVY